ETLVPQKEFVLRDSNHNRPLCNPWKKGSLSVSNIALWFVHTTAPLMLEAIQDLLIAAAKGEKHPLVSKSLVRLMRNVVYVEERWLYTVPPYFMGGTLNTNWATKDVLGFFSILLTNLKNSEDFRPMAEEEMDRAQSTRNQWAMWIKPRKDWDSVFIEVVDKLPERGEGIWGILEHLACYKNTKSGALKLDERYCTGTVDEPVPTGKLMKKSWPANDIWRRYPAHVAIPGLVRQARPYSGVRQARPYSGVRGLESLYEPVLDSRRRVPVWELHHLGHFSRQRLLDPIKSVHRAVREFHRKYPNEPVRGERPVEPVPTSEEEEMCRKQHKWWHWRRLCGKRPNGATSGEPVPATEEVQAVEEPAPHEPRSGEPAPTSEEEMCRKQRKWWHPSSWCGKRPKPEEVEAVEEQAPNEPTSDELTSSEPVPTSKEAQAVKGKKRYFWGNRGGT
ncbi:hypothetical protein CTA2_7291, partial [Colletotrichum tanaceti]